MSSLRALLNLILVAAWTALLLPVQAAARALGSPLMVSVPMLYHRGLARILGLRVQIRGTPSDETPTLFTFNHSSWLDITVIDSLVPVCFIAKQEVASWPLFGILAKLQRTVFVQRIRNQTGRVRDEMRERLEAGDNLALFAEGTSGDGNRVLPFRSSFFALAEPPVRGRPLAVQPVSIAYVGLNGAPLGRHLRPEFTWFGDMDLAPHIWRVLGLGPLTVVVTFHPPVTMERFASRKEMTAHAEAAVARGLSDALSGRSWGPKVRTLLPGKGTETRASA
jgi:1-acyl-sn-glycerol-3-phosphate acyltransferase